LAATPEAYAALISIPVNIITVVIPDRGVDGLPCAILLRNSEESLVRVGERLERNDFSRIAGLTDLFAKVALGSPDVQHDIDPIVLQYSKAPSVRAGQCFGIPNDVVPQTSD